MKTLRIASLFLLMLLVVASSVSAQELPLPCRRPARRTAICPMIACPRPPGGVVHQPRMAEDRLSPRQRADREPDRPHQRRYEVRERGQRLAEGTWVFPLPLGATVDSLTMYINDTPIEAQNPRRPRSAQRLRQHRAPVPRPGAARIRRHRRRFRRTSSRSRPAKRAASSSPTRRRSKSITA